jgi:glycosyltransferase involved in cell wall biosynthesis
MSPLRIAINCELAPDVQAGGTQSVVSGLVRALGELQDGAEEYILICHPENRAWIEAVAGRNTRLVNRPQPQPGGWRSKVQTSLARTLRTFTGEAFRTSLDVPRSDGFYESLGAQVLHWPWQHFVVCSLPSVFNPHDLLHLHYPQFFQPREIVARERLYPFACRIAHTIVVGSEWVRQDLCSRYGIDARRVQVIPWAPPTRAIDELPNGVTVVREKFSLPAEFALYPAVTWEHKNHMRLLAALADLRDRRGRIVKLVCTGHRFERQWAKVEAELNRLKLQDQVQFLGAVTFPELRAIYHAAQFVFVPTLFEAASGPVFEAWQEDVPVACSNVTSLPQQAGNAALVFDPTQVAPIADALDLMSSDAKLRETLRENGRRRLLDFPWERTARAYRATYRRTAGVTLSDEDAQLLAWDWMRDVH